MEWTEIAGYFGALLVGFSLGFIGGGGSILTVPILKYLLGFSAVLSTAYSLFIVGIAALWGSIGYFRRNLVNLKAYILFAIPSLIAVSMTRKFVIPALPDPAIILGISIGKDVYIMCVFAIVMILASYSMIRSSKTLSGDGIVKLKPEHYLLIITEGLGVGVLTGFVGAGGGFLIVPALVLLVKLPILEAIGTSLLIIATKSLIGFFYGDATEQIIDWNFLLLFSLFAVIGIFIGTIVARKTKPHKIKSFFGWFVLVMGLFIILKELLLE